MPGLIKVWILALGKICGRYVLYEQADIDSAFRRIPVAPGHRWACGVAFKHKGKVVTSQHAACPFGAIASVHAWERIGAAIAHIARKFLKIAVLRYVDDLFAPERCHVT